MYFLHNAAANTEQHQGDHKWCGQGNRKAVVVSVTRARGMEVAGSVNNHCVGEDIGKVCNIKEALEVPIMNDLTMVLGSISQALPIIFRNCIFDLRRCLQNKCLDLQIGANSACLYSCCWAWLFCLVATCSLLSENNIKLEKTKRHDIQ